MEEIDNISKELRDLSDYLAEKGLITASNKALSLAIKIKKTQLPTGVSLDYNDYMVFDTEAGGRVTICDSEEGELIMTMSPSVNVCRFSKEQGNYFLETVSSIVNGEYDKVIRGLR